MSAERIYRAALLAYPRSYRGERGDEIVATVLDGGEKLRLDEVAGLLLGGVACRGRLASGGDWGASMRAGLRLGAFVQLWLGAVVAGTQAAFPLLVPHSSWSREVAAYSIVGAVVAVLAVVAAVRGLWFAPLALAVAFQVGVGLTLGRDWTVWPWHLVGRGPASFHVGFVGFRFAAIGLASFVPALLLLVARPRRGEPRDLRSWWWVAALVPVAGLIAWQGLWYSSWLGRPLLVALALWLVLGRRDPRLAAAGAAVAGLSGASLLVDKYSSAWMSAHTWLGYLLAALAAALATRAVHARRLPA